ncbi:MAG: hypothetical protein HQL32_09965 [Planctomycetes bacterium]|nr:hypothetical protein [Planctomycetota bacterium]
MIFIMSLANNKRSRFSLVELLLVIGILMVLTSMINTQLHNITNKAYTLVCANNLKSIGSSMEFYMEDNNSYFPPASFSPKHTWLQYGTWDDLLGEGYDGRDLTYAEVEEPARSEGYSLYECPEQVQLYDNSKEPWKHLRSYSLNCNSLWGKWYNGISSRWGNVQFSKETDTPAPARTIAIAEFPDILGDGYATPGLEEGYAMQNLHLDQSHKTQFNYLFVDNHIEFLFPAETYDPKGVWWGKYSRYWTRDPND